MSGPRGPRAANLIAALGLSAGLAALSAARGPAAVGPTTAAPDSSMLTSADSIARVDTGAATLPGFTHISSRGPFVYRMIDGEPVTLVTDSVLVANDTVTVTCDSALYYEKRETYDFRGRVRLAGRRTVLTCRRAVLRRLTDALDSDGDVRVEEQEVVGTAERGESRQGGALMRLIGRAELVSPEYTVWADTIVRLRDEDFGEAFGSVRLLDPTSRTQVTGEHATFRRREGTAVVDQAPTLTTAHAEGAEPLAGTARLMRFRRDPERVVMIDSVRVRQGRQEATADTATVIGRERVLLRGAPVLRDGARSTMRGREIDLLYREEKLERVLLRGGARVEDTQPDSLARLYPGLPPRNVLEGDTMTVEITDGAVQRTTVRGAARSLYVPEDTSDEIAANDVKGDTIVIDFRAGRVEVVNVRGGMSGTYGFVRRENLPAPRLADAVADSAGSGVAVVDTAQRTVGALEGFDFAARRETVVYSGNAAVFRLGERTIDVTREAKLTYGSLKLDARHVRFDTAHRELYADGDPLLEDSNQKIAGDRMGYSFDHHTGAVRDGVTTYDRSYYAGRQIRRYEDGTLKIRSGRMTSCDLARPHYHFWSDRMKIRMNDKVVASPIVMKIGEVPVFALPIYFKSLKSGRRSGILFPNFGFGWTSRDGRFIRDWGYYWATNDYLDFTLRGDYNERRNLALRLTNRYVKRYAFSGGFDWSRSVGLGSGVRVKEWQLNWNHNQETLFDVYTLRGDVRLASRTLTRNDLTSDVSRDVISGQRHSTVFLSRNWENASGSLNLTRDQQVNAADSNPATDNVLATATVPQLNVSFRRRPVLAPLPAGQRGSLAGDLLRAAYFSHSYAVGQALTSRELTDQRVTSAKGDVSVEWRPPRLLFLNLSSGVQASQSWQRFAVKGRTYAGADTTTVAPDSFVVSPVFADLDSVTETTRPSLAVNSSASATLYGLFPVKLGALQAIRHTLVLAASHSFRPALGAKQLRSSVFGFSLDNRFDVKLRGDPAGGPRGARGGRPGSDAAGDAAAGETKPAKGAERKLDGILGWHLAASYDPNAASRRRWSTLSSGITIKPGQSRNLSFRLDNTADLYARRITSTRFTYGLNLTGRLDTGVAPPPPPEQRSRGIDRLGALPDTVTTPTAEDSPELQTDDTGADAFAGFPRPAGLGDGKDPTEGGRFIPWNLSTSISYSNSSGSSLSAGSRSSARANISLSASPTRGWDLSYSAAYDLDEGVTLQNWSLLRDLHCWALEFSRMLSQVDSQFGFRIYLKSIPAIEMRQGVGDLNRAAGVLGGGLF